MTTSSSTPARPPRSLWLGILSKILIAVGMSGLIAWMLLVLAGTFHHKTPETNVEPPQRILGDQPVGEVTRIRRARFETAIGTIKPIHEAAVASKILARVVEVAAKAGQAVTEGDVLVRLDDKDLQARYRQAEAAVAAATAKKEQADADLTRVKQLFQKKIIPKAEYDQAEAAQRAASAEWERARQAEHETQILLGYATITSPLTGMVIDKKVEAGDTAAPGQVLLTLYDPTHMQMVASVRESLALRLKIGQRLPASLESLGYHCEATVSEIVPEAQAASRSFTVKVTGPCPPGVYSGMFGRLMLPLDDEQLVSVPRSAVQRIGQLTIVDVVGEANRLQRRSVQLGREIDGSYEVLAGLVPGEKVVLSPAGRSSHDRTE